MAAHSFFGGTFFPIQQMPSVLRVIVSCLPLTHTNQLLRFPDGGPGTLLSLGVLLAFTAVCLFLAVLLVRHYSE